MKRLNKILLIVNVILILSIGAGCLSQREKASQEIIREIVKAKEEGNKVIYIAKIHEYGQKMHQKNKQKAESIIGKKRKGKDDLIRFISTEETMNNLLKLEPNNQVYQRILKEARKARNKVEYLQNSCSHILSDEL